MKEINDKDVWENFLSSQKPGTFLQSWNWGEVNKAVGYEILRLGFFQFEKVFGVALLIHQPAKRGPHFLIPGGPVVDFENKSLVSFVFDEIKKVAKKRGGWFVRIRPDVPDSQELRKTLKDYGFVPAQMHVHGENTLVLDINRDDKEILGGMRKTTRYCIKRALNEGYRVTSSVNSKGIENLYKLQKETAERHRFVGFQKKMFLSELEIFGRDGQALLFECRKRNSLLASAIVVFYGKKAFYHFSGSSKDSLRTNASYFLQWEIIKKSRSLGYKYYDFWGIAPRDDPKHRFWGVTVFKKGFGGERIDWLHAHDLPLTPTYWLTYLFETGRRVFRRL